MNEYRIEFPYKSDGRRVRETDYTIASTAINAADEILREYSDLDGLRIEQVWVDTGRTWDVVEIDY